MDRLLVAAVRKLPKFGWIKKVIPAKIRAYLRRFSRVPIPNRPNWDEGTKRWVLEKVGEAAKMILKFGGKSPDFWKLG